MGYEIERYIATDFSGFAKEMEEKGRRKG